MSVVLIVLCGPSGSGKSTLLKKLFADFPEKFGFSVSHTTRNPRVGEVNGKDYHFITQKEFEREISLNSFVEHAEFSGNCYGTSLRAIQDVLDSKKNVILDIDMQGVLSLKKRIWALKPLYIFISPPSLEILALRLKSRGTENDDSLQKRLQAAKVELEWGTKPNAVDHIIINDDIEKAYNELKATLNL
ncbi:guanylate kinase [Clydaea vesicula]|uniref:Guanylate kinase n=1 Tax=Clydaea vesicula TaxID=447962 RepID=A0AAD5U584_9FUNG|nr:guanylate kinase [Clydaea vesicula]KAJ3390674.1 guanylate kinase [Lobulomyces angularis]